MRVVVAGGTGFIGRALCRALAEEGREVVVLSRRASKAVRVVGEGVRHVEWDARTPDGWGREIESAAAIVNLVGENIGAGRWNEAHKRRILQSRVGAARAIVEAVRLATRRPGVVVQGSAVGYYGARGDEPLEESSAAGDGFLAGVVREVEAAASGLGSVGVRSVLARTGVVLGHGGGMIPRLMKPFRYFVGGAPGGGRQWVSWVHLEDEVRALLFLMERTDLEGAFNLTAPAPERMADLCRSLGRAMHRPSWLPIPAFVLRLAFGEMADEVMLSGARVLPRRLLGAGFSFRYPDLPSTLADLFPHQPHR